MGRLRAGLDEVSVQFGDSERLVSVSIGVCVYPEHASSVTELLLRRSPSVKRRRAAVTPFGWPASERRIASLRELRHPPGLVIVVDTKDRYTKRHSEDVARYAVFPARAWGWTRICSGLSTSACSTTSARSGSGRGMRKPSKLTADEYAMFQHAGDAIVRDVPNVDLVRGGIRHHHERGMERDTSTTSRARRSRSSAGSSPWRTRSAR